MRKDRLALLQSEMKRRSVGALYIGSGVTLRYVLNQKVPGSQVFVPASGEAIVFVRPRDAGYVSRIGVPMRKPLGRGSEALDDGREALVGGLKDLMREHGVGGERLGIDGLETGAVLDLVHGGFDLVDAEPIIERAWTVKTPDEVAIYRAVGAQYVTTFNSFRNAIRPGVTERMLAHVVTSTWEELEGEDIAQLNVCAGENMNPWSRWPTNRVLKDGDFVGIDLHARGPGGMRGDESTTFFVGDHPSAEQRDLYRRASDYLEATLPIWKAGRTIADVMADVPEVPDRFREKLWDLNYAHGCGLGSSGYPHVNPRETPIDDVLRENQVLSIEVYFGEEGSTQAVKLEQMLLVHEDSPELLGPIPMDRRLIS
ncbi:MAG TPA: M24 family metallopeptidase [Chloroflexota bacterium]|nr:M24 family metallopeptidase [Chloroflexota bacterium]